MNSKTNQTYFFNYSSSQLIFQKYTYIHAMKLIMCASGEIARTWITMDLVRTWVSDDSTKPARSRVSHAATIQVDFEASHWRVQPRNLSGTTTTDI